MLIANAKPMPIIHKCPFQNCFYATALKADLTKHKVTSHVTTIKTTQVKSGDPESMLELGVRLGLIPEDYVQYRQKFICVFDIECLESEYEGKKEGMDRNIEKAQKIVSLAAGSNIPGTTDVFICRESSDPEDEELMIKQFVDYLEELHAELLMQLPS